MADSPVLWGSSPGVTFLSGTSGEEFPSNIIRIVGRVQFPVAGRRRLPHRPSALRSHPQASPCGPLIVKAKPGRPSLTRSYSFLQTSSSRKSSVPFKDSVDNVHPIKDNLLLLNSTDSKLYLKNPFTAVLRIVFYWITGLRWVNARNANLGGLLRILPTTKKKKKWPHRLHTHQLFYLAHICWLPSIN